MLIKFWGVRGSISAPGENTITYGGNTPCLQILGEGQESLVIDAGYGVVRLGEELAQQNADKAQTIHLLLTHHHWDHIQGLPFFIPIYLPKKRLVIYSSSEQKTREAMERLFTSVYSPIKGMENLAASIAYQEIGSGFELGNLKILPSFLNHPVPTLGLRISEKDRAFFHASDHEGGDKIFDDKLAQAAQGVNLLIHDAQFTPEEYQHYQGWGHSDTKAAVKNALTIGVPRLVLFHFDPTHNDENVEMQVNQARELVKDTEMEVLAAAEGLTLTV